MRTLIFALLLCANLACQQFNVGVWLQDPPKVRPGQSTTVADEYAQLGVTHFMGIYQFPDESIRYPGYNAHAMQALADAGLRVYAGGERMDIIQWLADNMEYVHLFDGVLVGDEPDMTKAWYPHHHPDTWLEHTEDIRESLDAMGLTHLGLYANFGKGIGKNPWIGYSAFPGPTIQDDHEKFFRHIDLFSVDVYITDPYENGGPNPYVGLWIYAESIKNTRMRMAEVGKAGPVWGFVECGNAFSTIGGYKPVMDPRDMAAIVWLQVIAGAEGIIYFPQHRLQDPPQGVLPATDTYPLEEPYCRAVMRAVNMSLHMYEWVLVGEHGELESEVVDGMVLHTTRRVNNHRAVFAIGNGNALNPDGVTSTFRFRADNPVLVHNTGEVLEPVDGWVTDTIGPYKLRVYVIRD